MRFLLTIFSRLSWNPQKHGRHLAKKCECESEGLNDAFVDKQLLFLISQQDDKTNKNAAIREYNKLKQRITEKMEIKSDGIVVGFKIVTPGEEK